MLSILLWILKSSFRQSFHIYNHFSSLQSLVLDHVCSHLELERRSEMEMKLIVGTR